MKKSIQPIYTFTPVNSTLNLSGIANFSITKLFAVIDATASALIYATGQTGFGYSALSGTTLTLQAPMTGLNSGDQLLILYDDGFLQSDVHTSGTIVSSTAQANYAVSLNGHGEVGFTVTGLTASGAVLTPQGSYDYGTTWSNINAVQGSTLNATVTADGSFRVNAGSRTNVRLLVTTTGTGNISVVANASAVSTLVAVSSPVTTTPGPFTITQTVIPLTANTSVQLVGQNLTRKSLRWMNIGANPVSVSPGSSPSVYATGMIYNGAGTNGQQGGSEMFEGSSTPTNAFQMIATLATTVVVWEGA